MVGEKTWRRISTDKYVLAGIITLLIFSLGITLGFLLENSREGIVENVNKEQEVRYMSLQLQYLFLNYFSNQDNCPILTATLQETISDLSDSLSQVIAYEENKRKGKEGEDSALVQRRYVLDNLRYWLLAKESKQKCNMDIVPILYFYRGDCPSCPVQGTILSFFKNQLEEQVLVFPINLDLREEEPMVEIIASQYGVTQYPTLIVDNQKLEGVVKKAEMQKIICASLKEAPQCQE